MSESERSPLLCASLNRKRKLCAKLGHHRSEDGRRWCRSHLPDDQEVTKESIKCVGRLADDSQCRSTAEQLLDGLPVCHFHARITQQPSSSGRQQTSVPVEGGELPAEEAELLGGLAEQLRAAGDEFSPLILATLKKMLLSSNSTANAAAVRILLERYAPADGGSRAPGELESYTGDVSELSDAELAFIAYSRPGMWQADFHRENNMGSRVKWLKRIDERIVSGGHVDAEELQEARVEADYIIRWRRYTDPLESLAFAPRPAGLP